MAIKKCPYCKAFIEEDSEFCSNCGTKLIFPEDEDIEEEIPGKRIIELEEQEAKKSRHPDQPPEEDIPESGETGIRLKEDLPEEPEAAETYPSPPSEEEKPVSGQTADDKEGEDLEESIEESAEKNTGEYLDLEEESLDDKEEDDEEEKEDEKLFSPSAETPPPKGISPFEGIPELEEEKPADSSLVSAPEEEEQDQPAEETPSSGSGSWLFPEESSSLSKRDEDSGEMEEVVDSADKEKEEIERFLDSLKKERQEIKERIKDVEGDLPPWAERMKNTAEKQDGKEDQAEEKTAEQKEVTETKDALEIPVAEEEFRAEASAKEEIDVEAEETPALTGYNQGMLFGSEQEESSGKDFGLFSILKLSRQLKSRLFDVFLIAGLWLASLWIAAYLIGTPVFSLITEAVLPAVGFFVILITVYFGLFLVFLRETLGDLLFSKEK